MHFHQFEKGTSNRIRNERVNEKTGEEVAYDDIVKGAEIDDAPIMSDALAAKKIAVAGGVYDLATGKVNLL